MCLLKKIDEFLGKIFLIFLGFYQRFLSPDHSFWGKFFPFLGCRFYPSCSEYAKISVKNFGFFRSLPKILSRIFRCNPLSQGGVDHPLGKKQLP